MSNRQGKEIKLRSGGKNTNILGYTHSIMWVRNENVPLSSHDNVCVIFHLDCFGLVTLFCIHQKCEHDVNKHWNFNFDWFWKPLLILLKINDRSE